MHRYLLSEYSSPTLYSSVLAGQPAGRRAEFNKLSHTQSHTLSAGPDWAPMQLVRFYALLLLRLPLLCSFDSDD